MKNFDYDSFFEQKKFKKLEELKNELSDKEAKARNLVFVRSEYLKQIKKAGSEFDLLVIDNVNQTDSFKHGLIRDFYAFYQNNKKNPIFEYFESGEIEKLRESLKKDEIFYQKNNLPYPFDKKFMNESSKSEIITLLAEYWAFQEFEKYYATKLNNIKIPNNPYQQQLTTEQCNKLIEELVTQQIIPEKNKNDFKKLIIDPENIIIDWSESDWLLRILILFFIKADIIKLEKEKDELKFIYAHFLYKGKKIVPKKLNSSYSNRKRSTGNSVFKNRFNQILDIFNRFGCDFNKNEILC